MGRRRHYAAKGGDPAYHKRFKPRTPKPERSPDDKQPVPKRKYAIIFGYLGTGYHGMQKQVNEENENRCKTIEGVLEKAIKDCGGITQAQIDQPSRLQWGRVGRTDKGVHAACQVVTLKMSLGPMTEEEIRIFEEGFTVVNTNDGEYEGVEVSSNVPEANENVLLDEQLLEERKRKKVLALETQRARERRFAEKLQAALPEEFEIYDVVKVAGFFDARLRANRRRYEYCLPLSVLRPAVLVDNREPLYKFYRDFINADDTSEMDQMFVSFEDKQRIVEAIRSDSESAIEQLSDVSTPDSIGSLVMRWRNELAFVRRLYASLDGCQRLELWNQYPLEPRKKDFVPPFGPNSLLALRPPITDDEGPAATDADIDRFRGILKQYLGNHHWYNFTSRIQHDDSSGSRYLEAIDVQRSFCSESEEDIVVVRLLGQSFLLNQIRKMVSAALEATLGLAPLMTPTWLFTPPLYPKKHLHLAPGEGLLLERAFYEVHNRQRDEIYTRMILHDDYEQENPHAAASLVKDFKTLEGKVLVDLVDAEDRPTWWKVLKFKTERIYPWVSSVFKLDDVWTRFKADLSWHPFASENFPIPVGPHDPEYDREGNVKRKTPEEGEAPQEPMTKHMRTNSNPESPCSVIPPDSPTKYENILLV